MNKQGPNIFDLIESYYHDLKQELGFNPENIDEVKVITRLGINESGSYDYVMADGKSKKAYRIGEDLRILAGLHVLPQKVGRSRISDKAAFWLPGVADQYSLDALKEEGADPTETLYRAAAFIVMEIVRLNTLKVDEYKKKVGILEREPLLPIQSINYGDICKILAYLGVKYAGAWHSDKYRIHVNFDQMERPDTDSFEWGEGYAHIFYNGVVQLHFKGGIQEYNPVKNPHKFIQFVTELGYEFNDYSV